MKHFILFAISTFFLTFPFNHLDAQTPDDALMMKPHQACLLLDFNYASFDQYWEGTLKRENQTIALVKRKTIQSMAAIGLTDKLNFFVGVPYVHTESRDPNGGKFAGANGIQDLLLAIKYQWLGNQLQSSGLKGLASISFATPLTNYLPDYMPYSIGIGATRISYNATMEYRMVNDFYIRGNGGFQWRGYAEAEREYYYNGGSYYTHIMDVPNALSGSIVVGKWLFDNTLQLEVNYNMLRSLSGDDIRAYNAPQPTNKVNMDRAGIFLHYYFQKISGLGLVAYHNRILGGRNAPASKTYGIGITYFFSYRKSQDQ